MKYTTEVIKNHVKKLCDKVIKGESLLIQDKRFLVIALQAFAKNYELEEGLYSEMLHVLEKYFNE